MYKLALVGLIFMYAFTNVNQTKNSNNIETFLKEFVKERDCSKISFSGNLFSFSNSEDVNSEIDLFQLFIFKEGDLLRKNDISAIKNMIRKNRLELLNMVKSKNSKVEIYIKEKDDIISDVFMLVQGEDNSIIFHAEGNIRYKDLKKLNINFDGSEELKGYGND